MREIREILHKASAEERRALAEILDADNDTFEGIADEFAYKAQSIFGYVFDDQPSYSQIVRQVAEKIDIRHTALPIKDLEIKISQKVLETVWEKMTPEQKVQMEAELQRTTQEFEKGGALAGSASIFTALTAAKLSGFGVYLLASTSLGALTGAIGVTLPFAIYTTMSSTIAVILGPVGWIGAGLFAIWKLTGANYKRLIPAVVYVSMLRAHQEEQRKREQEEQRKREQEERITKWVVSLLVILALCFFVFWLS